MRHSDDELFEEQDDRIDPSRRKKKKVRREYESRRSEKKPYDRAREKNRLRSVVYDEDYLDDEDQELS